MADKNKVKQGRFQRRKWRTRARIFGSTERPRLSVYRSEKHIYAQLIDDLAGRTLATVSSREKEVLGDGAKHGANVAAAQRVGQTIAERAKSLGITQVAFDRGGRQYHGRVKALADAARKGGLSF
jgi:large subunit ribosomal protein L18